MTLTAIPRPCQQQAEGVRCGALHARHYLTGWCCPAHTPAALAGRPDPLDGPTYPEPNPGAQAWNFRPSDTALADGRARSSGKRASGAQRRASHADQ